MTRDVIEYTSLRNASGLVVSLDQEQAFDRLEHEYLFGPLKALGFSVSFACLLHSMYTGIRSIPFLNGIESEKFFVTRGVHQGCPLSPVP